jgi:16S rRNA (cytosine967-C5)-methyltransferase
MLAIETLSWMDMQRLSERQALTKTVRQLRISDAATVGLAQRLVYETVRRQNLIDEFIGKIIKPRTISEFDLGIQAFLRLYVYQTRMAKNRAIVDVKEAENIAGLGRSILGWKALKEVEPFLGFLITENMRIVFDGVSDEKRIGFLTYNPLWFVKYCFRLFGRKESLPLLEALAQSPPTYVRLNTLQATESRILEQLAKDGIVLQKVEGLKFAHKVTCTKQALAGTESFRKGLIYVQDKASCYAAEVADPKPGMAVLDVCAAPGAKTTYLAQLVQNCGIIYSLDFSRRRMQVWKREVARMNVEAAEPIIADARRPLPLSIQADVVVLDPPCTSTGAFGKSPSAKWRLTLNSIENMAEIQWRMINSCADAVKPEGTLVYSTCSVTVEENEMIIERFLKHHAEFALREVTPKIGLSGFRGLEKCQRLYPHVHECNGFFIAKLAKQS